MKHTPAEIVAHLRSKTADHRMQSAADYIERAEAERAARAKWQAEDRAEAVKKVAAMREDIAALDALKAGKQEGRG